MSGKELSLRGMLVVFRVREKPKSGMVVDKILSANPSGRTSETKYIIQETSNGLFHIVSPEHILKRY